ncbi:hypothetical protein BUALT_Bualt19G0008200 [Buddleja alternifolia]|uniref:Polygalacturonase n=1 Tax=Buddleja alternifolia TaxID=168488 RepID=A0AAV6W1M1_9LAMI|nr:hypothetical protein BUALT_Bualt19G0008200 [Buddleja alternifolia]
MIMKPIEVIVVIFGVLILNGVECRKGRILNDSILEYSAISCRAHSASIVDYGGVGDGKTLNTQAFKQAVDHLSQYASDGGAQLFVPAGNWLTGSFNLTSHFTLYLHKDAVLLASQDITTWPVVDPLPSYGHGRDAAGGSNVIIQRVTIIAPVTSPNTDGINPDSCTNTRIEDTYIISGDDCIAVKSGWDEYGIKYGMPTKQLIIRRLTCISPYSAAIALGSEMSGGIQDVRAEDITAIHTESAVRIKTGIGRGGYVKDIFVKGMDLHTMKWVFWITGNYGSHADNNYDPNALPEIKGINYRDVVAENVTMAARLEGISGDPFTGICMSNVTIGMAKKAKKYPWTCVDVAGVTSGVVPPPCELLPDQGGEKLEMCKFPSDSLAIDSVELQKCSLTMN